MVIAKEGRLEEEMFLTTFLCEEAKHTEFFPMVLKAIGEKGDLSHLHTGAYKEVFYEVLPKAMNRLIADQSPQAQAEAATVYNMFVEGVLAETGYFSFYNMLEVEGIVVKSKMEELSVYAIKINQEGSDANADPDKNSELTLNFMMQQLSVRMQILARAKEQEMDEILNI